MARRGRRRLCEPLIGRGGGSMESDDEFEWLVERENREK